MAEGTAQKSRLMMNKQEKFYPRIVMEDHYTMTDGDGHYLHHITKPEKKIVAELEDDLNEESENEDADADQEDKDEEGGETTAEEQDIVDKKPAEEVADQILEWIYTYGVDKTLEMLAGDSTKFNTGWHAGVIAWIEKKLGRKLTWLICQIHTNETGTEETHYSAGWKDRLKEWFLWTPRKDAQESTRDEDQLLL